MTGPSDRVNLADLGGLLNLPHSCETPGDARCLRCVLSEVLSMMAGIMALTDLQRRGVVEHLQRAMEERNEDAAAVLVDRPSGDQ